MATERRFAEQRVEPPLPPEPPVVELPKPQRIGKRTQLESVDELAEVAPVGKQVRPLAVDDEAPTRASVREAVARDLAAIRQVALPAHARAIAAGEDGFTAALTVQHMLVLAEQRLQWIGRDQDGSWGALEALIAKGVAQGVYRRSVGGGGARRAVPAWQLAARGRGGEALDGSDEVLDEVMELVRGCGSGAPLPADLAARMAAELGGSFERVRIHVGGHAAAAARLIHARAFTIGDHIYFEDGEFAPGTDAGDRLLRHELTHVQQHARGELAAAASAPRLIEETSAIESEARAAEATPTKAAPAPVAAPAAPAPAIDTPQRSAPLRAPAEPGLAIAARKKDKPVTPVTPVPGLVDLTGRSTFEPGAAAAAAIEAAGKKGAPVRVKLGASTGIIQVKKTKKGYVTVEDKPQVVPLSHKLFVPLEGVSPVIRVSIGKSKASEVTGFATLDAKPHSDGALGDMIGKEAGSIGLVGFALKRLSLTNELANGQLTLATRKPATFELGGWVKGELSMSATTTSASVEATAHVSARGLVDGDLLIRREENGTLRGSAELGVNLGDKFSGRAKATYVDGDVAISGTLGYTSEKFRGSLNIVVADAAEAEAMVKQQVDPGGVLETTAVAAEPTGTKTPKKAKKGERGIAGSGELDFSFTDWLTGRAAVVYGPSGHLTVMGKIAPPKRFDLMKQPKSIKQDIMPPFKLEASYGLPYVADVHLGISLELYATAELGPIYMTDMAVEGVYSTDPTVMNAFSISGALRAQAHAGLVLDVKGYGGLRILKHSINFGAGVKGEAGVRAYAEARPTLGYREVADPLAGKKGEYYLKGHLEMAAQPVLSLGGRLFVELDSPWWSPAPDKTWEWPIGKLEYPMPFQMGVGADIDYVLGSDKWPDLKLSEASFDPAKFIDQTMDDQLPAKSGHAGEQDKAGSWKQGPMTPPTKPAAPTPPKHDEKAKASKAKAPASATTAKKSGKGKQTEQEKQNVPQTKDAAERWAAGMEALGKLRERADKDPETSNEIHQHLAELKSRHGFTQLTARRQGDLWLVDAAMNPTKKDIPIKADPKDKPGAKPDDKHAADDKHTAADDQAAAKRSAEAAAKRAWDQIAHRKTELLSEADLRAALAAAAKSTGAVKLALTPEIHGDTWTVHAEATSGKARAVASFGTGWVARSPTGVHYAVENLSAFNKKLIADAFTDLKHEPEHTEVELRKAYDAKVKLAQTVQRKHQTALDTKLHGLRLQVDLAAFANVTADHKVHTTISVTPNTTKDEQDLPLLVKQFKDRFHIGEPTNTEIRERKKILHLTHSTQHPAFASGTEKLPGYAINIMTTPGEVKKEMAARYTEGGAWKGSKHPELAKWRAGVAIGVNAYHRLDETAERKPLEDADAKIADIRHVPDTILAAFSFGWVPTWLDKTAGDKKVSLETVRTAWRALPEAERATAIKETEAGVATKQEHLPYGAIRSHIIDKHGREVAEAVASDFIDPVHAVIQDADGSVDAADGNGVLAAYDEVLAGMARQPLLTIGGYRFKGFDWGAAAGSHKQQLTELANAIDHAIRDAIAVLAPEVLYPTEPNMLVKAIDKTHGDGIYDRNVTGGFGQGATEGRTMRDSVLAKDREAVDGGAPKHEQPVKHAPEVAIVTSPVPDSRTRGLTVHPDQVTEAADPTDPILKQSQSFADPETAERETSKGLGLPRDKENGQRLLSPIFEPQREAARIAADPSLSKDQREEQARALKQRTSDIAAELADDPRLRQMKSQLAVALQIVHAIIDTITGESLQKQWTKLAGILEELRTTAQSAPHAR